MENHTVRVSILITRTVLIFDMSRGAVSQFVGNLTGLGAF